MKTNMKILLLAATLALASACAKKDEGGATIDTTPTELHQGAWIQSYYSDQSYVTSQDAQAFERAAVDLARTAMSDPNMPVGGISHANGVTLRGKIFIDERGLVLAESPKTMESSQILLVFSDYYVGQGYDPIELRINATAGKVKGGQLDLTLSDDKGSIWLKGTYDSAQPKGYVSGTITYQNAGKPVVTLGQFRILTCGIVDCSQ